jgi:hypothetical protein
MPIPTMSNEELLLLIFGITFVMFAFTGSMFVLFKRFLDKEKQRGENFRAVHKDD